MYETFSQKIYVFILELITKYVVWITIIAVAAAWYFYPDLVDTLGKVVLLWAPLIVLIAGFAIVMTANTFKFKRQADEGITQQEIIVSKYEIYFADILVYFGAIAILIAGHLLNANGVGIADLVEALIYFIGANRIKNIFYKKIIP